MGKWAGQPNYFIEKVWSSLTFEDPREYSILHNLYQLEHAKKFGTKWDDEYENIVRAYMAKPHTIRAGNRWKAGMDIHFATNPRSKNYFQFAPVIPCVSVQEIEIIYTGYSPNTPVVYVHNGKSLMNPLSYSEIKKLAQNDGFDSVEQFFAWFDADFKGKIIHWTDLTY